MKNYIQQGLACLLLLAVAVALFNIWADPYNIYRFSSADADRMSRVDQTYTMRLSKPWQVLQHQPGAAIIGSSRSGSIAAPGEYWQGMDALNLSMAGLTLYEMQRMIEHAQNSGPLSQLFIGLEYETFISDNYKTALGFAEQRLAPTGMGLFLLQALRDFRDTTFTTSATTRSAMAIEPRKAVTTRYFPDGSWQNNSRIWRGESGYIFMGKNMIRLLASTPSVYADNMDTFAQVLRYCHQQKIAVTLFISPEHIFLTDLRQSIDSSARWQGFHADLASTNENIAHEEDQEPFPLWGFNHIEGIVDEPLPRGDILPEAWFRDGIHFNRELGRLLMSQMQQDGADLGYSLTSDTTEGYLDAVEALRIQFVEIDSGDIQRYRNKIL
jgi:hypothetical protein